MVSARLLMDDVKSLPEGETHLHLLARTCPDARVQMESKHNHQALRALRVRPCAVICRSEWKERIRVVEKPG